MFTLYKITNSINDKVYIGQTKQALNTRWVGHQSSANRDSLQAIHCAMRKYGIENFSIDAIAYAKNLEEANEMEKQLIISNNSLVTQNGYNIKEGGGRASYCISIPKTDEHKEKLQIAHRKNAKPIVQYNWRTGEVIKVWVGFKEARRNGYSGNIQKMVKSDKGYGFAYDSGWAYLSLWNEKDTNYFIDPAATPWNGKRVFCYTKDGELVKEYSTLKEAAEDLGLKSPTAIGNCLKGRSKTCAGFAWRWE